MDNENNKKIIISFLNKKNIFAVVGVSKDIKKYGNKVYITLKKAGYKVYPINPNLNKIFGDKCYSKLKNLPEKPDVVSMVVQPNITNEIVKQCNKLNIDKIWMQPGSESEESINYCKKNNIKVLHGVCVIVKQSEK